MAEVGAVLRYIVHQKLKEEPPKAEHAAGKEQRHAAAEELRLREVVGDDQNRKRHARFHDLHRKNNRVDLFGIEAPAPRDAVAAADIKTPELGEHDKNERTGLDRVVDVAQEHGFDRLFYFLKVLSC